MLILYQSQWRCILINSSGCFMLRFSLLKDKLIFKFLCSLHTLASCRYKIMQVQNHSTGCLTGHRVSRNKLFKGLAPVFQKADNTIHRINLYPLDSVIGFPNIYPLDGDLSGG